MLDLVAELAGRRVRSSRLPVERQDDRRKPPTLPTRLPPATAASPASPTRSPPVRPEWSVAAQEALLEAWADVAWRWCRAVGAAGVEEGDRDPIDHSAHAS